MALKGSEGLPASPGSAHRIKQRPGPGEDHHQPELQRRWARCGGWEGPGAGEQSPCVRGPCSVLPSPYSELRRSHVCLPAFGPHVCTGSHAFLIEFVFLLSICLTLTLLLGKSTKLEGQKEKMSLPHNRGSWQDKVPWPHTVPPEAATTGRSWAL